MQLQVVACEERGEGGQGGKEDHYRVGGFSWDFAWGATLVSTRYCGLQASRAPTWVAADVAAWRRAVVLVSRGGGAGFGAEGVVVFICPANGVASLGVAVWALGLGLLDGQRCPDVLSCLWASGRGVCP